MAEFELLNPEDKPALLAMCNEEWLNTVKPIVTELGYKAHAAITPQEFDSRFASVQYQLVIIDELFNAATLAENVALQNLQTLPMANRRHATILLIGDSFQTMHPMQAFQQSVHAVVNRAEVLNLNQIIQKVAGDNDFFLHTYRDMTRRIAEGKA
jgi:2-polyprenyl-6-methoxyphenol hydroxylase-like FAD-dependent oxidoreductase